MKADKNCVIMAHMTTIGAQKKRGRPRKEPGERLNLMIDTGVAARLKLMAAKERRSLGDQATVLLDRAMLAVAGDEPKVGLQD